MNDASTVYVGIGSNLDDPANQVERAIRRLNESSDCSVTARSSLYLSAPVGYSEQPDFINAVCEIATSLAPLELISVLHSLESEFGRIRSGLPNRPRIIDLDLLLFEDIAVSTDKLTIPHPRMHERLFVLDPLAEIAPDIVIPGIGRALDLIERLDDQRIEKISMQDQ